jgi:hypothetical protein
LRPFIGCAQAEDTMAPNARMNEIGAMTEKGEARR